MGAPSLTISNPETPWYRLFLHTPLTTLTIFVILCLIARENYPFSNFPMYASPSAERAYFVIANGGGNPIPISTLTGVTSSQIGKTYRKKSRIIGGELKKSGGKSRSERDQVVAAEIFSMLRQRASKRGKDLPEKLQLQVVEIRFADGRLEETKRILFAE